MSDFPNPFVSPENPLGAYDLPPEDFDAPTALTGALQVDSIFDGCTYAYGAAASPMGALAIVRFQFTNSATRRMVPVDFVSTADVVTKLGSGISIAAARAAQAARRVR